MDDVRKTHTNTISAVKSFYTQGSTKLQVFVETQKNLDTLIASKDMSEAMDNKKHANALGGEIETVRRQVERMRAAVVGHFSVDSVEEAAQALIDLDIRMQNTQMLFEDYRRLAVSAELLLATGQLVESTTDPNDQRPTIAAVTENILKSRELYEAQLKLMLDSMPAPKE